MKLSLVLVAVLLAGCGGGHPITGTFVLINADVVYGQAECQGPAGYSDIKAGTGVVVKDGAGKTIGTSNLVYAPGASSSGHCAYTFTVTAADADFYAVSVGHRGELTYSKAEMAANGWKVELTLGE